MVTTLDIKAYLLKFFFDLLGWLGRPILNLGLPRDLEIVANLRYGPAAKQRLDVLRRARCQTGPQTGSPTGSHSGAGSRPLPVLVFFHGGGWISADKKIYRGIAAAFSCKGFVTFNVNYRLAPRDRFAAPLEDAHLAIDWICRHAARYGGDPSALVLAGDSAGAQIASWYASALQEDGLLREIGIPSSATEGPGDPATGDRTTGDRTTSPAVANRSIDGTDPANPASGNRAAVGDGRARSPRVKALLLFYGVYDFETVLSARFPFIRIFARSFLGADPGEYARNARIASPICQVSAQMPPVWLCAGERDGLFPQSQAYAEALADKGVPYRTLFFSTKHPAYHGFFFFRWLKTSRAALTSALTFLRECAGIDCQIQ